MARATAADRLRHILDAIAEIEGFAAGRTFDDHLADAMLRRAAERCLEIISEASRHIPPEAKARHSDIPWRGAADFGNVLRHGYEQVIDARVWGDRDARPRTAQGRGRSHAAQVRGGRKRVEAVAIRSALPSRPPLRPR